MFPTAAQASKRRKRIGGKVSVCTMMPGTFAAAACGVSMESAGVVVLAPPHPAPDQHTIVARFPAALDGVAGAVESALRDKRRAALRAADRVLAVFFSRRRSTLPSGPRPATDTSVDGAGASAYSRWSSTFAGRAGAAERDAGSGVSIRLGLRRGLASNTEALAIRRESDSK